MTMPPTPGGTLSELSRTSPAFSPKIARRSFSSGESWVSPFGVILPTRMSPGRTSAPMRTMPESSRSFRASSPTFGMSRVISSLPSLVSRATHSNSSMWIEVNTSSLAMRSRDEDRVLEVVALPRHERDEHVLAERELAHVARRAVGEHVALLHVVARPDDGLLRVASRLVRALELGQVVDVRHLGAFALGADDDARRRRRSRRCRRGARPCRRRSRARGGSPCPCRRAARSSESSGTAWRCMFAPMSARFASSCSRKGTSAAATRHHLVRRDVHELDHLGRDHPEVAVEARRDEASP